MSANGVREFDFTRTVRIVGILVPVVLVVGTAYTVWTTTEQPQWIVPVGAVVIALGTAAWLWFPWTKLVRRATLDEHRLRGVTASGREHVIERADVEGRPIPFTTPGQDFAVRLVHPGGELYVLRPPGTELVDLLDGARAWDS